uniref:Uncharacterized protein n=1 Tax=Oryza sativa subsp. japonica TaxID=39947 RepID=Q67X75_ORYSJ|nr:hypothetical protein [Oryza sativa Japonica Group]
MDKNYRQSKHSTKRNIILDISTPQLARMQSSVEEYCSSSRREGSEDVSMRGIGGSRSSSLLPPPAAAVDNKNDASAVAGAQGCRTCYHH